VPDRPCAFLGWACKTMKAYLSRRDQLVSAQVQAVRCEPAGDGAIRSGLGLSGILAHYKGAAIIE
jgi:hypothetical protein